MLTHLPQHKRVVLVHWKNNLQNPFEVYSSLKIFCETYREYNYNTISNYLSKRKIAFDNDQVHIERKNILTKPAIAIDGLVRKIIPVVRKVHLKKANDPMNDLEYWLSKPPLERLEAVTFIISQSLTKGQRMDKSKIVKRKLKA